MNKIIGLWVHPRSLSTVMERVMIERGDFKVFHEPFAYLYYVHDKKAAVPYMKIDPDHPQTYPDTKKWMLAAAEENPVCFKDMAYYVTDYIMDDEEFLNRMVNTFMIREPAKTILSYYKVDPNVTRDEIGFEYLFKLFRRVADLNDNQPPVVISAEDLVEALKIQINEDIEYKTHRLIGEILMDNYGLLKCKYTSNLCSDKKRIFI